MPSLDVPVSVDTSKPEVMRAAIAAGAGMINDVTAPERAGCDSVRLPDADVPVCLMHMQGEPSTMQTEPQYDDVVADIIEVSGASRGRVRGGGIARERLLIDPGFGFGKTLEHNLALLRGLERVAKRWVCRCWWGCRANPCWVP